MIDWQFDFEDNKERNRIIDDVRNSDEPIAIYGTGKFAISSAKEIIRETEKEIWFIDPVQYYYKGKTIIIDGKFYDVVSEAQSENILEKGLLISGLIDYGMVDVLRKKYPRCKAVEYLDVYTPHIMNKDFVEENEMILKTIYKNFADNESRNLLRCWVDARITGNVRELIKFVHSNTWNYDWNLIRLNENDVIVDGGAYIGDTVAEIEHYTGNKCKRIYAFEPDENNFKILKKKYGEREDVICINAGIYNKNGKVSFSGGGTLGSSIVSEGLEEIEVKALDADSMFKDVSVIKLDVEGSERQALEGAKKIIEKNIPNLAVCIYHNNRDIIDIWNFIQQTSASNAYKYYLRQHSRSVEETVLYAVNSKD